MPDKGIESEVVFAGARRQITIVVEEVFQHQPLRKEQEIGFQLY
jgi:hypothetical protein